MKKATLKALKGAVIKWHDIRNNDGVDRGGENCPLCHRFSDDCRHLSTRERCPVMLSTGKEECQGTAYYDFKREGTDADFFGYARKAESPASKRQSTRMLNQLVDLLPPDESCVTPDGWEYFPKGYTE